MKNKVVFRTDGNSEIGMGHLTRSLALAYILKDHFECVLATRYLPAGIQNEAAASCSKIIQLSEGNHENELMYYLNGNEIVVLDNYFFDCSYQRSIKEKGSLLVVIDDLHDREFCADAIINHAPQVTENMYKALPETKFYLGLDYALLRSSFFKSIKSKETPESLSSVFLCFGGADIHNYTERIFESLKGIVQIKKINIVVGTSYKFAKELKDCIRLSRHQNTMLYSGLAAEEMINLMYTSDMAIVPSSSILFEVLKIGMPVLSGYYTENQLDIYNGFLELNAITGAGDLRANPDFDELVNSFIKNVNVGKVLSVQRGLLEKDSSSNLLTIFKDLSLEGSNIN